MGVQRGVSRIATAVRWLGRGFAALILLAGLAGMAYMIATQGRLLDGLGALLWGVVPAAFVWGIGEGFAWIIEGFVADVEAERPRS